jgi:ClpP class serine protease
MHAVTEARPKITDDDMQGQCFYADDARARGLIDYVGDMDDAIAELQSRM